MFCFSRERGNSLRIIILGINEIALVRFPNYNFEIFDRTSAVAFPDWEVVDELLTSKEYFYTLIVNPVIYTALAIPQISFKIHRPPK